jgi:hypothetical protein
MCLIVFGKDEAINVVFYNSSRAVSTLPIITFATSSQTSPNLRELTSEEVREGSFQSLRQLVRAIEAYLVERNRSPKK